MIGGVVIYFAGPSVVKTVTANFTKASTGTPIKKLRGIVKERTILSNIGGGPVHKGKGGMKLGAIRLENLKSIGELIAYSGINSNDLIKKLDSIKINQSSASLYKKLSRYNTHLSTRVAHSKAMEDRVSRIENRDFHDFTNMEISLLDEYINSIDQLVNYLNKDL